MGYARGSLAAVLVSALGFAGLACSGDSPTAPTVPTSPAPVTNLYEGSLTFLGSPPLTGHQVYDCVAREIAKDAGSTEQVELSFEDQVGSTSPQGAMRLGFLEDGFGPARPIRTYIGELSAQHGVGLRVDLTGTYPKIDRRYWSVCSPAGEVTAVNFTIAAPAPTGGSIVGTGALYIRVIDSRIDNWDIDASSELAIPVRVDLRRR